jgi:hypothetical protein
MKQYECWGIKQVITTVRRLTGLKIHKEEASFIGSLCKDLRKARQILISILITSISTIKERKKMGVCMLRMITQDF